MEAVRPRAAVAIGFHRVYYNGASDAPFIWSVDDGGQETEQIVRHIVATGCLMQTGGLPESAAALVNPKDTPVVWLEIYGHLRVDGGVAVFTPC